MASMFIYCKKFNCNISEWDVSKVTNMKCMFYHCKNFNQNLDSWNVSNVIIMWDAFKDCPTQPKWYDRNKWENER
jgi:surface protein